MTYIPKPKLHHPDLPKNKLGFTHRDYEGSVSTLCAGCGHDSISAAVIQACFELDQPMPDILAMRCGGNSRLKQARTIAALIESWPQPAHSVDTAPS